MLPLQRLLETMPRRRRDILSQMHHKHSIHRQYNQLVPSQSKIRNRCRLLAEQLLRIKHSQLPPSEIPDHDPITFSRPHPPIVIHMYPIRDPTPRQRKELLVAWVAVLIELEAEDCCAAGGISARAEVGDSSCVCDVEVASTGVGADTIGDEDVGTRYYGLEGGGAGWCHCEAVDGVWEDGGAEGGVAVGREIDAGEKISE